MIFALVAGSTETARIEGISAAGATPALLSHTPGADTEIVKYGRPVQAPVTPVSPSGCPTPAVITRAVREKLGFEMIGIDAGLVRSPAAPTISIGTEPGQDIRTGEAVSNASEIFERARELAVAIPTEELVIGETIPGGTTTALAVLDALGERATVSSSLPENPMELKHTVVEEALEASELASGELSGDPIAAVEQVGDPVLAAVFGLIEGATTADTDVMLAGGTQLAAAGALARHAGVTAPLTLATTRFVADDESVELEKLTADLGLDLTVTDPGFDQRAHPALDAYVAGEAKEGVGMGGALALSKRAGIPMADLREQTVSVYERLLEEPQIV